MMYMKKFLIIYVTVLITVSIIAFIAYCDDKRRARQNKWRIKEFTLLCLGVLGGALGALVAMKTLRHKTKHWYFWVLNLFALTVHIALPIIICLTLF